MFALDPEQSHRFVLGVLRITISKGILRWLVKKCYQVRTDELKKDLFDKKFFNPIGLAAGFDKDALAIESLSSFGFGFIEIGTVTPKAQDGNPKKRLFRLSRDYGLINRMGFNSEGSQTIARRLKKLKRPDGLIIGVNIGKNKDTPIKESINDYLKCLKTFSPLADFITINVSSPNTPELQSLQEKELLKNLINKLITENNKSKSPVPILLKISPDLSFQQVDDIVEIVEKTKLAGIVAVNTTLKRDEIKSPYKDQKGGLSGRPLFQRSLEIISYIKAKQTKPFCIIGVGGIQSPQDALKIFEAGADLIQIYTGLVYQGPRLIKRINQYLLRSIQSN